MTIQRRDGQIECGFSQWTRGETRLESIRFSLGITDRDYWIHRYMPRHERARADDIDAFVFDCIMMLEVKTFNADSRYSQRDTLDIADHLLRHACLNKRGNRVSCVMPDRRLDRRPGAKRHVKSYGVHYLRMSGESPATSDKLFWDNKLVTLEQLILLLLFELDPDHPEKSLIFRRHHRRPQKEETPPLLRRIK